ncbi:Guanine nucleotide-binding protein subunit beta-like protein 1 [Willisornis vidua]|uniref:Guanine nucleotide-binding protein subunit beta-like protein 1 n=1 Tax=Willisornis vidua TaxID=1566151 RepID=A0ABQ9CZ97_9PASS|nr:Guanine nucleotide-binding protein subunit beta-like protein 1 [Willisornis vidua]
METREVAITIKCGNFHPPLSKCQERRSENGLIHVWNLKTHRVDTALDGHGRRSVYCVETMGGRDRLLSPTVALVPVHLFSVKVQVLELPSKTSVCTLKPEMGAKLGMPMCLKLWQLSCGSQPLLLAGYEDGSVVLWSVTMGKVLSQLVCHQEPVMSLDFDSEKAKGISGSSEKVLCIWSLNEQQNLQVDKTHELVNAGISGIAIRPDKRILATAGWDHRIRIFGWKKLKPLAVLDYHTATVHCVSFSDHRSAPERLLAAGSRDHRISVWSVYTQT